MFKFKGIYQTAGISAAIRDDQNFNEGVTKAMYKFMAKDWGDTCDEDKAMNEQSLKDGSRILADYNIDDKTIWIIADAEDENGLRTATILFPDEY